MFQMSPYLVFDGQCADAMKFYEQILGGTLEALTRYKEMPDPARIPPDSGDRVMHVRLSLPGAVVLMAGDAPAGFPYKRMEGIAVALSFPSATEAHKVFRDLAEGGNVTAPMAPSFWAEAFGMVTDRFGTPWIINGAMRF